MFAELRELLRSGAIRIHFSREAKIPFDLNTTNDTTGHAS